MTDNPDTIPAPREPLPGDLDAAHCDSPDGVALVVARDESGRRRGLVVPHVAPRGRRRPLTEHQGVVVSDLQRLAVEAQLVEGRIRHAVHHARELGVSWALVGFSVGLSDVGARKRFGEPHDVVVHVEQGA